jgi:short-subunit dehydrogenase involved in D-alanine esterification of teichoic acids
MSWAKGKTALVTGGSQGIGHATALAIPMLDIMQFEEDQVLGPTVHVRGPSIDEMQTDVRFGASDERSGNKDYRNPIKS